MGVVLESESMSILIEQVPGGLRVEASTEHGLFAWRLDARETEAVRRLLHAGPVTAG